jgi:hypothetical protein
MQQQQCKHGVAEKGAFSAEQVPMLPPTISHNVQQLQHSAASLANVRDLGEVPPYHGTIISMLAVAETVTLAAQQQRDSLDAMIAHHMQQVSQEGAQLNQNIQAREVQWMQWAQEHTKEAERNSNLLNICTRNMLNALQCKNQAVQRLLLALQRELEMVVFDDNDNDDVASIATTRVDDDGSTGYRGATFRHDVRKDENGCKDNGGGKEQIL